MSLADSDKHAGTVFKKLINHINTSSYCTCQKFSKILENFTEWKLQII